METLSKQRASPGRDKIPMIFPLPPELLEQVFFELDYICANTKIRAVCRRFDEIVRSSNRKRLTRSLHQHRTAGEIDEHKKLYAFALHPCITHLKTSNSNFSTSIAISAIDMGWPDRKMQDFVPLTSTYIADEPALVFIDRYQKGIPETPFALLPGIETHNISVKQFLKVLLRTRSPNDWKPTVDRALLSEGGYTGLMAMLCEFNQAKSGVVVRGRRTYSFLECCIFNRVVGASPEEKGKVMRLFTKLDG